MDYQRKYDFQAGTRISSQQMDDELNQIIDALNTFLTTLVPYTGAASSFNLNGFSLMNGIAELVKPGANGIINLPNQSAVIASNTSSLSVASGVNTKVSNLTTVSLDRQSEFSSSKFTAKESGVYVARFFADWGNVTPPSSCVISAYKNGANYSTVTVDYNKRYSEGVCLVQLSANEYLEFYINQSSGASISLVGSRFEIAKLM